MVSCLESVFSCPIFHECCFIFVFDSVIIEAMIRSVGRLRATIAGVCEIELRLAGTGERRGMPEVDDQSGRARRGARRFRQP